MIIDYLKIFIFCLIIFLTIGMVSAAEDTDSVNGTDTFSIVEDSVNTETPDVLSVSIDDNDIISTEDANLLSNSSTGTFTELNDLITSEGNYFELDKNYTRVSSDNDIKIEKSLTLDGKGHTLNANGLGSIFLIGPYGVGDNPQVRFNNIIFTNASSGAINFVYKNANFEFNNCTFIDNNRTSGDGGAAICSSTAVDYGRFNNVEFIRNTVWGKTAQYGAAVYFKYSSTDQIMKNVIFNNVNFTENSFSTDYSRETFGGAIAICLYKIENLKFIDCNFENNSASSGGGAFYRYFNGRTTSDINVSFFNTDFRNNKLTNIPAKVNKFDVDGGAFCYRYKITNSELNILDNCVFDNNVIECPGVQSAYNKCYGAAVYFENLQNNISRVNFTNNRIISSDSKYQYGGAVFLVNSYNSFKECVFSNNSAGYGGAVTFNTYSSSVKFMDTVFSNNTAYISGGALYYYSMYEGLTLDCDNVNFTNNSANEFGGAVYVISNRDNSNLKFNNTNFYSNNASMGSAIYTKNNIGIFNSTILNNTANVTINITYDNLNSQGVIECVFGDNYLNAIYSDKDVEVDNVTYFEYEDQILNTDDINPERSHYKENRQITIKFYDLDGNCFETKVIPTQGHFTPFSLDVDSSKQFTIEAMFGDEYYIGEGFYSNMWGDFAEIQRLVHLTSDGGILELLRNYTYTIGLDTMTEGIKLNKTITIDAHGFTIDALYKSRVFNIVSDNVKLININFVNASCINGSFIHAININHTHVENCSFKNNLTYLHEGAPSDLKKYTVMGNGIYVNGSDLKVINSNFTELLANCGGAIYFEGEGLLINMSNFNTTESAYGGAVYVKGNDIKIHNSNFTSSSAVNGGAICFEGEGLLINMSNFNTTESAYGGAVYVKGNDIKIHNSNFTSSSAVNGGALYLDGSDILINESYFIESNAQLGGAIYSDSNSVKIYKSHFISAVASAAGGAIKAIGADYEIIGSTFYNTCAEGVSRYDKRYKNRDITPSNLIFKNNDKVGGGAIYSDVYNMKIVNSSFDYCKGDDDSIAGVIYTSTTINISESNFTNSSVGYGGIFLDFGAYGSIIDYCIFDTSLRYYCYGGAILSYAYNVTVSNSVFRNMGDSEYDNGGIVCFVGNENKLVYSNFTNNGACSVSWFSNGYDDSYDKLDEDESYGFNGLMDHCIFKDYDDAYYLVVIYASNTTVRDCLFDNLSGVYDSVFEHRGFDLKLTDSNFTNCVVEDNSLVSLKSVNTFVDNCLFDNNTDGYGAIFLFEGYNLTIQNSNFTENTVKAEKYGICTVKAYDAILNNCRFDSNSAKYCGGVLTREFPNSFDYYYDGNWDNVLINNSKFINNSAEVAGAVICAGYKDIINESVFYNNSAVGAGALFCYESECKIINSNFTANKALLAGAIAVGSSNRVDIFEELQMNLDLWDDKYYSQITGSNFVNNSAEYAPTVFWAHHWGTIENSTFENNRFIEYSSQDYADTMYKYLIAEGYESEDIVNRSEMYVEYYKENLEDSLFKFTGTAIYWIGEYGTVNNCSFKNHQAGENAGAIYWQANTGLINNSNFINSTSKNGGAVLINSQDNEYYFDESDEKTVLVNSSRFINNTAELGGAIYVANGTVNVTDSGFIKNTANNGGAVYWISDNGTVNNSKFTDNSADLGGALYIASDNVNVTYVEFINNTAKNGGAVCWQGNSGILDNAKFFNNTAFKGGAVYCTGINNKISESEFKNNKAESGSALYTENDLDISSTSFLENQAKSDSLTYSLNVEGKDISVSAVFKGQDNLINAIYTETSCSLDDVTYWSSKGVTTSNENPSVTNLEDGINITLELYDSSFKPITVVNMTNVNGEARIALTNLRNGRYFVFVKHAEDAYYTEISKNDVIQIGSAASMIDIEAKDIFFNENATIDVSLPSDAKGNVTFEIDGRNYTVKNLTNAFATANITGLAVGVHNVTVYYSGDENYVKDKANTTFTVKQASSSVNIKTYGGNYSDNILVNISVNPADASGKVIVAIENEYGSAITINDTNEIQIVINSLNAGKYNITVYYTGDSNYLPSGNQTELVVNPVDLTVNVIAGNVTVDENSTFTLTLPEDFKGKVNITVGEVTKIYDVAGSTELTFVNLPIGEKTANVTFFGDDNYNNISVQVKFNVTKSEANMTVNITDVTHGKNATATVKVSGNANGTVNITVDGKTYSNDVVNGEATLILDNVSAGVKTASAKFITDDLYNSNTTATAIFTVAKANATLIITNQTKDVVITLPEDAKGNVTVYVNGEKYSREIKNGKATVENVLKDGENTVIAIWNGDNNYNTSSNSTKIGTVADKKNSTVKITNESGTVFIDLPADAEGNLTVYINDVKYTPEIVNGRANVTGALMDGNNTVVAIYSGDVNYAGNMNASVINVEKVTPPKTLPEIAISADDRDVIISLPENAEGNLTVYINGEKYTPEIQNGKANVTGILKDGNNTVVVIYSGDANYTDGVNATSIYIESPIKQNATIKITNQTADIVITFPEGASGNVTVYVNGKNYTAEIINGNATVKDVLVDGNNSVVVVWDGDDKYNRLSNSTVIELPVSEIPSKLFNITVTDLIAEGGKVIVNVTGEGEGSVNVTVDNGTVQSKALTNGEAVFDLTGLSTDRHEIVVTTPDGAVSKITIDAKANGGIEIATIKAENMTRGYGSPYDYQAAFLDAEGNALVNTVVTFKVNGKEYNATTNSDGIAQLTDAKLAVGKYNITSINTVTGESITRELEIVKRILENKDMTMDYTDGSVFKVKVIGDDGNIAPEGSIISITANGVSYVAKVDSKGYTSLKINLLPKTYKVVCEFNGYKTTNKLVVKQILKPVKKTIKVKKSKKSFKIKATLKWSNKKPIKGKKITFKIKGKTLKAKTNKKGVATVKVKKSLMKKLKKGKTYTVKITYAVKVKYGDAYQTISDTVKCKVKVK